MTTGPPLIAVSSQYQSRDAPDDSYTVSAEDEAKYNQMFTKVGGEDGYLSGRRAAALLKKCGLPQETLAKIWEYSDEDADGKLSPKEFCVAMHLVRRGNRGLPITKRSTTFARQDMKCRNDRRAFSYQHNAFTAPSNNVVRKVRDKLARSPKRQSRMASLLGDSESSRQEHVFQHPPEQDVAVTGCREEGNRNKRSAAQDEAKYAQMFAKFETKDGKLEDARAANLNRKSCLSKQTLAKIWALANQDADGSLSLREFCGAMRLVLDAKRGIPLPHLPEEECSSAVKPSKCHEEESCSIESSLVRTTKAAISAGSAEATPPSSLTPRRTENPPSHWWGKTLQQELEEGALKRDHFDRVPANSDKDFHDQVPACGDAKPNYNENSRDLTSGVRRKGSWKRDQTATSSTGAFDRTGLQVVRTEETNAAIGQRAANKTGRNRLSATRLQSKLYLLKADDVDAVYAASEGAINSLRDAQSSRVLVSGLQRLSTKDVARQVPVTVRRRRRRHTFPHEAHGNVEQIKDFLPGAGRRTSLLLTAYEPAAVFVRQRATQRSIREAELEQAAATAIEKWGLKLFPGYFSRDVRRLWSSTEPDPTMGDLNVSGQPLLDEDVDVLVHILRYNHAFRKLNLSQCYLSDSHIVALAQALAWNSRIEEVCMRECVFTDVGISALADVLMVNSRLHSIDIRDCRGLKEGGMEQLLEATQHNSHLSIINGMTLAELRGEGSDELNFSGRGLGHMECMVAAHCMRRRTDGLRHVDLSKNSISTEAFGALMVAFRKQTQLRSLDLSWNKVDERTLALIGELMQRNDSLVSVNLASNRICCSEFEPFGLYLMRLLSVNITVTVFNLDTNGVTPKMMTIIAEKLAANRAVRRDTTFVDCLHQKYPRVASKPIVADPRKLLLSNVDEVFMRQEGYHSMETTVRMQRSPVLTLHGLKPGEPLDIYFIRKRDKDEAENVR